MKRDTKIWLRTKRTAHRRSFALHLHRHTRPVTMSMSPVWSGVQWLQRCSVSAQKFSKGSDYYGPRVDRQLPRLHGPISGPDEASAADARSRSTGYPLAWQPGPSCSVREASPCDICIHNHHHVLRSSTPDLASRGLILRNPMANPSSPSSGLWQMCKH